MQWSCMTQYVDYCTVLHCMQWLQHSMDNQRRGHRRQHSSRPPPYTQQASERS